MQPGEQLLILGASVRAAAFSALRAGLLPWCVDRFADADLRGRCSALQLSGKYPDRFAEVAAEVVGGPWMYTGGMENHPSLVAAISARRRLWGNDAAVLRRCRPPAFLHDVARSARLPVPALAQFDPGRAGGRWLLKPLFGAGGGGVCFWSGNRSVANEDQCYLQEYIPGAPAAALYVAAAGTAELLGLTCQLSGEAWLHAPPFGYCGSIGPLPLEGPLEGALRRLGHRLAAEGGLLGLFGVDGILRDGEFWPVEINPRYTASVEVLEYAGGLQALHRHRLAFEDEPAALSGPGPAPSGGVVGKAILYARDEVTVPEDGPWLATLDTPGPVEELPDFADVPHAGERIAAGRPVLTMLARAGSVEECLTALRTRSAQVQACLGGGGEGRRVE